MGICQASPNLFGLFLGQLTSAAAMGKIENRLCRQLLLRNGQLDELSYGLFDSVIHAEIPTCTGVVHPAPTC